MKVNTAVLCMDCESVTEAKGHTCPRCGSTALWNLSRFIAGPPQADIDREVERVLRTAGKP